jgi:hypothetical protein
MGNVIPLRPRDGAKRAEKSRIARDGVVSGGAEIVLFLGVRYERHAEETPPLDRPSPKKGNSRKRA